MVEPNEAGVECSLDDLSWILTPDPGEGYEDALLGTGTEYHDCLQFVHDGGSRLGLFHAPGLPRTLRRVVLLLPQSRAPLLDDLADPGAPSTLNPESAQPLADDPRLLLWHIDCPRAVGP